MSAARRFALVLAVALATVALNAASARAQTTPINPSGGTGLRPAVEEGAPAPALSDFLARGSIGVGLRAWIASLSVSRYMESVAARSASWRTWSATRPRPSWQH